MSSTKKQSNLIHTQRLRRHFSDEFKQAKVQELEAGLVTVAELCSAYQCSYATVNRWIVKFGNNPEKPERLMMQNISDTQQLLALKQKVAELEQVLV